MVLLSSPRLWNFSHPPRGGALERMRVLWAYWPRRMVALPGQQKGKVEIMFSNLSPLLVMLFLRLGIAFSVPGYWSSVSTKTMLGLAAGASVSRTVSRAVSRAVSRRMQPEKTKETSTTSATEANGRATLFIPGTPFERAEERSAI